MSISVLTMLVATKKIFWVALCLLWMTQQEVWSLSSSSTISSLPCSSLSYRCYPYGARSNFHNLWLSKKDKNMWHKNYCPQIGRLRSSSPPSCMNMGLRSFIKKRIISSSSPGGTTTTTASTRTAADKYVPLPPGISPSVTENTNTDIGVTQGHVVEPNETAREKMARMKSGIMTDDEKSLFFQQVMNRENGTTLLSTQTEPLPPDLSPSPFPSDLLWSTVIGKGTKTSADYGVVSLDEVKDSVGGEVGDGSSSAAKMTEDQKRAFYEMVTSPDRFRSFSTRDSGNIGLIVNNGGSDTQKHAYHETVTEPKNFKTFTGTDYGFSMSGHSANHPVAVTNGSAAEAEGNKVESSFINGDSNNTSNLAERLERAAMQQEKSMVDARRAREEEALRRKEEEQLQLQLEQERETKRLQLQLQFEKELEEQKRNLAERLERAAMEHERSVAEVRRAREEKAMRQEEERRQKQKRLEQEWEERRLAEERAREAERLEVERKKQKVKEEAARIAEEKRLKLQQAQTEFWKKKIETEQKLRMAREERAVADAFSAVAKATSPSSSSPSPTISATTTDQPEGMSLYQQIVSEHAKSKSTLSAPSLSSSPPIMSGMTDNFLHEQAEKKAAMERMIARQQKRLSEMNTLRDKKRSQPVLPQKQMKAFLTPPLTTDNKKGVRSTVNTVASTTDSNPQKLSLNDMTMFKGNAMSSPLPSSTPPSATPTTKDTSPLPSSPPKAKFSSPFDLREITMFKRKETTTPKKTITQTPPAPAPAPAPPQVSSSWLPPPQNANSKQTVKRPIRMQIPIDEDADEEKQKPKQKAMVKIPQNQKAKASMWGIDLDML